MHHSERVIESKAKYKAALTNQRLHFVDKLSASKDALVNERLIHVDKRAESKVEHQDMLVKLKRLNSQQKSMAKEIAKFKKVGVNEGGNTSYASECGI